MIESAVIAQATTTEIISGLPVAPDTIFTDKKNRRKNSVEKRQKKLLAAVGPFLKPFLLPDEKVLLVTTACSPMSFLEQYLTGAIIYYLKRAYLIFTDRRILHVPTTTGFKYRQCIARILYSDCAKLSRSWGGGVLTVEYKGAKKEKFYYLAKKERAKIKVLLPQLQLDPSPASNPRRIHLCPRCAQELQAEKYTCAQCRLEFKDKDTARRISIIYPGGGYFYLGHPFLGIADAFVETSLALLVITGAVDAARGGQMGWIEVGILCVVLFFEKVISVYHSNHFVEEWIPKEKNVSFRVNTRENASQPPERRTPS